MRRCSASQGYQQTCTDQSCIADICLLLVSASCSDGLKQEAHSLLPYMTWLFLQAVKVKAAPPWGARTMCWMMFLCRQICHWKPLQRRCKTAGNSRYNALMPPPPPSPACCLTLTPAYLAWGASGFRGSHHHASQRTLSLPYLDLCLPFQCLRGSFVSPLTGTALLKVAWRRFS